MSESAPAVGKKPWCEETVNLLAATKAADSYFEALNAMNLAHKAVREANELQIARGNEFRACEDSVRKALSELGAALVYKGKCIFVIPGYSDQVSCVDVFPDTIYQLPPLTVPVDELPRSSP